MPYYVGFSLPQGAFIINTKKIGIIFSTSHAYYEDFDFCMQYLLKHRYSIVELRLIVNGTNVDSFTDGGCNSFRTAKNEAMSRKWIKDKWKSHVEFIRNLGGNIRPTNRTKRIAPQ